MEYNTLDELLDSKEFKDFMDELETIIKEAQAEQ